MLAVEDLGQRQVVAGLRLRPGSHRGAEARAGRLEAVHRDDERVLAPSRVVAVGKAAAEEHAVLNHDPLQLAGPNADQRKRRVLERLLLDLEAVRPAVRLPEPHSRRQQELLPRVRADRVAEARLVVAALESVAAGLLDVLPADRKLRGRLELVVDDRALAHARPQHPEAASGKRNEEVVQGLRGDHACLDVGQGVLLTEARSLGVSLHRWSGGARLRVFRNDSAASAGCVSEPFCSEATTVLSPERRRFRVRGVVQGVGFRPVRLSAGAAPRSSQGSS